MKTRLLALTLTIATIVSSTATAADGWDFTVGVGIYTENTYVGSDEYYVTPLPSLKATYTRGTVSYSLSLLEGLGVTYVNSTHGFLASLAINAGDRRNPRTYSVVGFDVDHSDKTRALLSNTPDLFTQMYIDAMFAYPTPIGMLGASAGYYPTTVEYNRTDVEDEVGHGFLYSVLYIVQRPISSRLSLLGMAGLQFMDQTYASTWYSVETATESLETFDADGGVRDVQIAFQLGYQVSERVSMSLDYMGTVLLGDAKRSPYSAEQLHQTVGVQTSYAF